MDAKPIVERNRSIISRRQWLACGVVAGIGFCHGSSVLAGSKSIKSKPVELKDTVRVRTVLEVKGEIRLMGQAGITTGKNGKQTVGKTAPLKATSTIDYDEQYQIDSAIANCRSYLHFHEATSEIQVDRHVTKTTLRDSCRDILKLGSETGVVTTCPDHPIFAAERDLIEGPVNSMFLDQILTEKEVKVTDKWDLDSVTSCRLLGLDAIQDGKLTVCLIDADEEKAQLTVTGEIAASVRQVATTIQVQGKAQVSRADNTVTWFAANIDETREIGEAEPGFKVTAQVRILRSKIEAMSTALSLEDIAGRVTNGDVAGLLQFQSDLGYYRFLANRNWSTYRDNGEEATLRYVVDNRLIAQCNVTNLIDYEPGRQLSLEGFQSDIQKSLSDASIEIVEAGERLSATGLRILRIVSRGTVQDIDIHWIHYHLSNDSGRRLALVYTLNEANLETFLAEDAQMAGSFELLPWPTKLDSKSVEKGLEQKPDANAAAAKETKPAAKSSSLKQPTSKK